MKIGTRGLARKSGCSFTNCLRAVHRDAVERGLTVSVAYTVKVEAGERRT